MARLAVARCLGGISIKGEHYGVVAQRPTGYGQVIDKQIEVVKEKVQGEELIVSCLELRVQAPPSGVAGGSRWAGS